MAADEHLLESWNDTATRQAIVGFVDTVTNSGGDGFVPPEERVAVTDNDGTLWAEKPMPIQLDFTLHRLAQQAAEDPSLREQQPWKASYEKDFAWLGQAMVKHYHGDDSDMRLLLLHDDPEREFDYTAGAERSLEQAAAHGWTVVSIRHDWVTVFGATTAPGGRAPRHRPSGPRAGRHRRRQRPGGPVPGVHHRRRRQPVGGQRPGGRPDTARVAARIRPDRAHGRRAAAAVPRPAAGRPRRHRHQRGHRVPQPARIAADRAAAARQLRRRAARHVRRPRPRRARRAAAGRGRVDPAAAEPAEPPEQLGPGPASRHQRLRRARPRAGRADRAGTARLPARRAAAVRQREAPPGRAPARLREAEPPVRIVLLDLQFTPELDIESVDVLTAFRRELHEQGVALWLANVRAKVGDMLRRSGLAEDVGEAHLYRTIEDAMPDDRAVLSS